MKKISLGSLVVDAAATASLLGIWPRFVEPKRLKLTTLALPLSPNLTGLRIVQISDLHFHAGISQRFLAKTTRRIRRLRPDIILFTGDFLCYSTLEEPERLQAFLSSLEAPLGCFCTFGNHDYQSYVTRNQAGHYAVRAPINPLAGLLLGLKSFVTTPPNPKGVMTPEAQEVPLHEQLCGLLTRTPFKLLENACETLPVGLNIVGLGDYALGRCRPETAFSGYDASKPGIVLSHNPDTFPLLASHPGELILSGHSHGEQIHLPFLPRLSAKLTRLEDPRYSRGLHIRGDKIHYINRGLGGHKPFRLFSPPELLLIKVTG